MWNILTTVLYLRNKREGGKDHTVGTDAIFPLSSSNPQVAESAVQMWHMEGLTISPSTQPPVCTD